MDAYTRCDKAACAYFVAAICRTNSNRFEFVRQIAATKFWRSDNDFHMSHEAICCRNLLRRRRRVAAICRIVCLDLYYRLRHIYEVLSARHQVFSKVIAARKANLITARARKLNKKHYLQMLAKTFRYRSIALIKTTEPVTVIILLRSI